MNRIVLALLFVIITASFCYSGDRVSGHWKDTNRDGIKDTYVNPYERSSPNNTRTDNYSYPGNYNPNTGKVSPPSNSPRETYPSNPNPYESQKRKSW
jgi:hypothetical protein